MINKTIKTGDFVYYPDVPKLLFLVTKWPELGGRYFGIPFLRNKDNTYSINGNHEDWYKEDFFGHVQKFTGNVTIKSQ